MSETKILTDEQISHYREHGFLTIDNLLTAEECDELNAHAVDVVTGKVKLTGASDFWMEPTAVEKGLTSKENPDPAYLFKIGHQMHWTDSVFRHYAMHEKILDILNDLVGPDIKCVQSMYIDKPKQIGVGQPYHQDSYYLKTSPDTLIGIWIACDDVDVANGCLHVIPGSQNEPIHPHDVPINPEQRAYFTEVHSARSRKEVACALPKGGAVIFPGTLLHRSDNNDTSDRQRRAYVLHYADSHSRWVNNPDARNPHLLVRGRQYNGSI